MRKDRAKKSISKAPLKKTETELLEEDVLEDLYLMSEPMSFEIIQLRQSVLHPTGSIEKVSYGRDLHPLAAHFVIRKHGEVIAVGTVLPEDENEKLSYTTWRIRGMAVRSDEQGLGLGSLVLDEIINYVQNLKNQKFEIPAEDLQLLDGSSDTENTNLTPQLIWCNARVEALNLYKRANFEVLPGEFLIPGSTWHNRLHLKLI